MRSKLALPARSRCRGGAEFRRESYTATEGDFQSYGAGAYATANPLYTQTAPGVFAATGTSTRSFAPAASGYGGTSPKYAGTSHQNSYGVYVGAEADVTKQLTMGIAGRYEHYDLFGGAVVGKLNAIYHVTDEFALRGTVGTGFHAPTPGQNNTAVLTTNFLAGQAVQVGTFPVTSDVAQFFGAKPLSPEKSRNFGFGFVFEPTSDLTLTVDAYQIKVTNRIFISKAFEVSAANIAALPELASVGVGGNVQFFTNSLDIRTRGVDVVGSYRTDLAGGKLNLTLAYNHNRNKVTKFDPDTLGNAQRVDAENLGTEAPSISRATGQWATSPSVRLAATSAHGALRAIIRTRRSARRSRPDLDVSYTFMDNFKLTVGGNNIFNTKPDRIKASTSNPIYTVTNSTADGQLYPRNGGPFGFNGGLLVRPRQREVLIRAA